MNVRTLCLGYLSLREATGYEIKKDFEEGLFCHFMEASYGAIYPALNQLAAEGLLHVREEEQTGRPDKKVYGITEQGLSTLTRELSVIPARDKYKSEFLFIMMLQNRISAGQRIAAMEKQLSDLRADLANIHMCRSEGLNNEACAFVLDYGEAVLTAGVTFLEQRLSQDLNNNAKKAAE